ncbi:MAG: TIGR01244 family sulfur transferase [Pseudomonadota bacterium]
MDRRKVTSAYSVSDQLVPDDVAALAASGVRTIINNRPDMEVPAELSSEVLRAATEAAGMVFVDNPVVGSALGLDVGTIQRDAIDASDGPVHAYCASGTRSTVAWALGEAGRQTPDEILAATAKAGYPLDGLRQILESLARG